MGFLAKHPAGLMMTAMRPPSWGGSGRTRRSPAKSVPLLLCLSLIAALCTATLNPRDNFCRRYAHQTTLIDDKLYIDGGWVNMDGFQQDHKDYPNTWLGYHNLNKLVNRNGALWPDLNISLSKNNRQVDIFDPAPGIPTVHGGVLWGDNVNKRFYLYGGEWTGGLAKSPYRILSYDTLHDHWDDFGSPKTSSPPNITSYGAGVGVSQTGRGYYYGGWISNASMNGWTGPRTMSPNFYSYAYDTGKFTQAASIDDCPRAEGAMVWIPAGDALGLLVYMGGVVSEPGSDTALPQPLDKIFVFDAQSNSWSRQTATGMIPQNRRQFCIDVAWAPDKSSFNIYLWGGLSATPPVVNHTAFSDVYILTLPSFTWVKAYPDHAGNGTLPLDYNHYSSSCNMVNSMSQMFVIGGTYPDRDGCDLDPDSWSQHNFWTGTHNNAGDDKTYWAVYDPSVTSNVVPVDVYGVVGGNKYGSATLLAPKAGFDPGNKPLQDLLGRRPSIAQRTPTRHVPSPTGTFAPVLVEPSKSALSTGAIVGIVVGSIACVALILFIWLRIGRAVVRRRETRRQSQMTEATGTTYARASIMSKTPPWSPPASVGPWEMESPQRQSSQPPSEHLTQLSYGNMAAISELPDQAGPSSSRRESPQSHTYA